MVRNPVSICGGEPSSIESRNCISDIGIDDARQLSGTVGQSRDENRTNDRDDLRSDIISSWQGVRAHYEQAPLAKALRYEWDSIQRVATGKKAVTSALALRVARFAGVPMDELLAGQWLSPRVCPHCGHPPDDFVDEDTTVG